MAPNSLQVIPGTQGSEITLRDINNSTISAIPFKETHRGSDKMSMCVRHLSQVFLKYWNEKVSLRKISQGKKAELKFIC